MEKRKDSNVQPKLPRKLLFPEQIRIVSPLSLEDCARRLREAGNKRTFFGIRASGDIHSESANVTHFYVKTSSRAPTAWIIGSLSPQSSTATLVSGKLGTSIHRVVFFMFLPLVFGLTILLRSFPTSVDWGAYIVVNVLFGLVLVVNVVYTRWILLTFLEENLDTRK